MQGLNHNQGLKAKGREIFDKILLLHIIVTLEEIKSKYKSELFELGQENHF